MSSGLAAEQMTTKGYNNLALDNKLASVQNTISMLAARGFDVAGLKTNKEAYENMMRAKFEKDERNALTDMGNDASLVAARLSGDKGKVGDAEYAITMEKLKREKEDNGRKLGNPQEAQELYDKKAEEAGQKRLQVKREARIEEFNLELEHNNMLMALEGKSQEEVDKLNRGTVEREKAYLRDLLQNQSLNAAERYKIEKELADKILKEEDMNRRDINKAGAQAIKDLKSRTTDYSRIMNQPFYDLENSIINNFTNILSGTQSFSTGFKNIFSDLSQSVLKMMVEMWYRQAIMKPLENWWGGLLEQWFPSAKKATTTSSSVVQNYIKKYGVNTDWLNAKNVNGGGKADGGTLASGRRYLVGEQGPELFEPFASGRIVPNNRIADALAATSSVPPVTVNVINNTGVQTQARQESRWDGQQYIVNVVLDAYARNVNGMRDVMGARRY